VIDLEGVTVRATATGLRIDVRVMPRAPRTAIKGARDGRLLIAVTAPPVDDAANEAVVLALAKAFEAARRSVRIVSGERHRNKTVEIDGLKKPTP
jgi:uncharacterized protein (TIGR00251 family)